MQGKKTEWTDEIDGKLRELYQDLSTAELSSRLGLSAYLINKRAKQLGLKRARAKKMTAPPKFRKSRKKYEHRKCYTTEMTVKELYAYFARCERRAKEQEQRMNKSYEKYLHRAK